MAWGLWLGILGFGALACDLWLWIFGLGSLAWDLWLGNFGCGCLALDLWLGIFGFGSLALDLWLRIFGLGSLAWVPELGNLAPEPRGTLWQVLGGTQPGDKQPRVYKKSNKNALSEPS